MGIHVNYQFFIFLFILRKNLYDRPKIFFIKNINIENKNNQNILKYCIKKSKYTLIFLGLINLNIRV